MKLNIPLSTLGLSILGLSILLFVPAVARAQILVAGEGPVVYAHHHLNTTNMDAQKKFYADTDGSGSSVPFSRWREPELAATSVEF